MRYTLITCELGRQNSLEEESIFDVLPPVFPSLLATCAPSTEFSLTARCGYGKQAIVAKDSVEHQRRSGAHNMQLQSSVRNGVVQELMTDL